MLNAGNSGSTIRMLSGVLAGLPFDTRIAGDESLARRPMDRIMRPLAGMGASIDARDGRYPPLAIHAARLHGIDYTLAGGERPGEDLSAAGRVERGRRNRGAGERSHAGPHRSWRCGNSAPPFASTRAHISVRGGSPLAARDLDVAGDLSSAAFLPGGRADGARSNLVVERVGLNPTRSALLDFLLSMGADVKVLNRERRAGRGNWRYRGLLLFNARRNHRKGPHGCADRRDFPSWRCWER
jgi:3-phosphoshikimate 1-carboxyvinyltransferase